MSVNTVIIKEQDMTMSYLEVPTVTLKDVAFAKPAAHPSQQDESPPKVEDKISVLMLKKGTQCTRSVLENTNTTSRLKTTSSNIVIFLNFYLM